MEFRMFGDAYPAWSIMASVILDAGHGGYDNGASYQGRAEKDDTLNLVLAIGNILQNNGVDVMYTRTEDVYQSPVRKAQIANESGADYFVSIHRNSSQYPNQYSGVQTLVFEDSGAPAIFADNINSELAKLGFTNIGTEVRKNLAVLRRTTMPAVLVEAGFINTERDNQIFDARFPEVAQAVANGILQSIASIEGGVAASGIMNDAGEDMGKVSERFTIETGMFSHEENAKSLALVMQEEGFDCYICRRGAYYAVCHGVFQNRQEADEEEKKLYEAGYETRLVSAE